MAYRRRRNARPKRKAESPEMRTSSVRSLTFATSRRFPQAMQDRFLDGYHSAKDALSEGAVSRAPDSPKGWREAIYNWLRLHGDEREQLYMDEPNKQGQAFRRGVKETAELAHSQHDPSASSDWGERFNPSARQRKKAKKWTIYHADHGINTKQMAYIKKFLLKSAPQGFFIKQWRFPRSQGLGTVYNAMWGPESGDRPVPESQVHYKERGDRPWTDRMIDRPPRPVTYGQALGIRKGDSFTLFTVYGGPLAPLNPADPDNHDVAGSKRFWKKHALSSHQWNPRAALRVPKHVMAEAQRAGVPRQVVARIARRKESAWEVLPSSLSGMKKRGKTYYLPVKTGYNTEWEYTISKNARGWVARFKPKRRGAVGYYLGDGGSQHRDAEYFRTAKSAFADAVAPHAMSGEYLKYRNPNKPPRKRSTQWPGSIGRFQRHRRGSVPNYQWGDFGSDEWINIFFEGGPGQSPDQRWYATIEVADPKGFRKGSGTARFTQVNVGKGFPSINAAVKTVRQWPKTYAGMLRKVRRMARAPYFAGGKGLTTDWETNPKRRRNISGKAHLIAASGKSYRKEEAEVESALAMRIHHDLGISLAEAWAMVRREGAYNLLSRGY